MPSLTQEQREAEEAVAKEIDCNMETFQRLLKRNDWEGVALQAAVRRELKLRAYERALEKWLNRPETVVTRTEILSLSNQIKAIQ